MYFAIVIDPPEKKHQKTQDAYDVAAIIANALAFDLCWKELHDSNTPTKSMANHIRKYGITLTFINEGEADTTYAQIQEHNSYSGYIYTVTRYTMAAIK
jgi:hypothetical protein